MREEKEENEDRSKEDFQYQIDAIGRILAGRRKQLTAQQELLDLEFKLLKETEDLLFLAQGELTEKFDGLESLLNISGITTDEGNND